SAISPDLWSDIAGVVRNLCLNWILLVPPMVLAVLTTKAVAYWFYDAANIKEGTHLSAWFALIMMVATLCMGLALSFSSANRLDLGLVNASQAQFLICDLALFLIGATLLVFVLASPKGQETLAKAIRIVGLSWFDDVERESPASAILARGGMLGLAIYFVSW